MLRLEIKGYITNLGKYNEGYLVGKWVTFPLDEDDIEEVFKEIGINAEYEEYFFTDWEDYNFGEYVNINEMNELAEKIDRLNDYEMKKLTAIIEVDCDDPREALEYFDDYDFREGDTLYDVACDDLDNADVPDWVRAHFDFDSYASELEDDGYTETEYGVLINN